MFLSGTQGVCKKNQLYKHKRKMDKHQTFPVSMNTHHLIFLKRNLLNIYQNKKYSILVILTSELNFWKALSERASLRFSGRS